MFVILTTEGDVVIPKIFPLFEGLNVNESFVCWLGTPNPSGSITTIFPFVADSIMLAIGVSRVPLLASVILNAWLPFPAINPLSFFTLTVNEYAPSDRLIPLDCTK